ncbi:PAS domain-containing sensor histidine kinase [Foetidibacter luteolus]|uniref:PAS domain-containing sensor histidine kinase n=1 Tax=Foetidibacter luteolus TaxID=2608880 RepID=UPI00129B0C6C|nr:PAS domain-containing sensor histidine kinase [Foetidibacter luteolus]
MENTSLNFELFFELSPDLLCIAGYDGYFKKINKAVSTLLGYSMEELYARPINDFVYQDDKDTTAKAREQLTKRNPLYNFENRYTTSSGEIVWLSWTSLPVDSDQLIFAIAKNITHKKRLEEERNNMLANLAKVNYDLKQLTYTTSHDLRSPVNNLLSIFSLIDVTKINDEGTVELIEILKSAGENLKQVLNNYVDALSEKHKSYAPLEEVNLQESLNTVLQSVNVLIKSSKAVIHSQLAKPATIRFNRAYMESVFLNLITNAIKYARPGYIPEIVVYSEKANNSSRLVVADKGQGFDMEKVNGKIFGLHQKFHNHTDSKGVGLYLVHSHITSLGGHISVESRVNEGTRFIMQFKE